MEEVLPKQTDGAAVSWLIQNPVYVMSAAWYIYKLWSVLKVLSPVLVLLYVVDHCKN